MGSSNRKYITAEAIAPKAVANVVVTTGSDIYWVYSCIMVEPDQDKKWVGKVGRNLIK